MDQETDKSFRGKAGQAGAKSGAHFFSMGGGALTKAAQLLPMSFNGRHEHQHFTPPFHSCTVCCWWRQFGNKQILPMQRWLKAAARFC